MTLFLILLSVGVISYFIGSISSAILVGKVIGGDDIRSHGSGNAGATNALRTYGKKAGILVTFLDCLKSAICCFMGILIAKVFGIDQENIRLALYSAGIGVALGHNFPVYFGFKGGKGILVSITAFMIADPLVSLIITVICIVVIIVTRYVSLGSVLGALCFIVYALVFRHADIAYLVFALTLSLVAIYRHRANINRLIHGKERKIGQKSKD